MRQSGPCLEIGVCNSFVPCGTHGAKHRFTRHRTDCNQNTLAGRRAQRMAAVNSASEYVFVRKTLSACIAAAMLTLATGGAVMTTSGLTATPAEAWPRKVRIYCKRDYKRFCPRYKVGSSRMRSCMRSYARNLSPICKKALIDSGIAARYGY